MSFPSLLYGNNGSGSTLAHIIQGTSSPQRCLPPTLKVSLHPTNSRGHRQHPHVTSRELLVRISCQHEGCKQQTSTNNPCNMQVNIMKKYEKIEMQFSSGYPFYFSNALLKLFGGHCQGATLVLNQVLPVWVCRQNLQTAKLKCECQTPSS